MQAVLRLLAAIDKVKQQLSGYTSSVKLPINVECLQVHILKPQPVNSSKYLYTCWCG